MSRSQAQKDFAELIAMLRREEPPPYPVRAYLRQLPDCFGYTDFSDDRYILVVKANMSWPLTLDTTIHEWAHVLTYDPWKAASHGPYWALVYGRLYQKYIDA